MQASSLQLVYALPCEKAIIADNGSISLIGLMEQIEITTAADAPPKFIAPLRFSVVSFWKRSSDVSPEDERGYEQKTVLRDADKDDVFTSLHKFRTVPGSSYFRNIVEFPGVPIGRTGPLTLETHLREDASDDWKLHQEYELYVVRSIEEVAHGKTEAV